MKSSRNRIEVDIPQQRLRLFNAAGELQREYTVSTARNGVGELSGSYQTPRGRHVIRAKIGAGMPLNAVFRGRRPTGEVHTPELAAANPDRDWILTRILWLSGMQPGFNRLGGVDSMHRYIYIHGTPDSEPMGEPASHGCIRMRNADVAALFELVDAGTEVRILAPTTNAVCYPVGTKVADALAARLQPPTGVTPHSPVPCIAPPALAMFDHAGEVLALGRLVPGGNAELHGRPNNGLPVPLLRALQQQAGALGWYNLRALVPDSWLQACLDAGGEVVSEPLPSGEWMGERAVRWPSFAQKTIVTPD
ncbi:L,D-transpeptidase [Andreprevotia chitinilytica]|uniref:L,D-transpeptidase n=1 Tax=Andreprevotia chitinilytica TaxID=396808 RepID=UPI000A030D36|nr:L,D-transpeptidase [Andreprevotia chitinilytica]